MTLRLGLCPSRAETQKLKVFSEEMNTLKINELSKFIYFTLLIVNSKKIKSRHKIENSSQQNTFISLKERVDMLPV